MNNCPAVVRPSNCDCSCGDNNVTKFYGLPLWSANSVTSWLVGINSAMIKIDQLFHDFALRTGVEGEPTDALLAIAELERNVKCLLEWQNVAVKDLAETTKILASTIGQLDLIQEKLRTVNFNYSNLDVRVKSIEQQFCSTGADMAKLLETLYSIQKRQDELDAKIDEIIGSGGEEPEPEEPDEEVEEDG